MKLNLQIMKEDLKQYYPQTSISSLPDDRRICFPVLYDGEFTPKGDRLYVTRAEHLPRRLDTVNRPYFICIGEPMLTSLSHMDILWLPDENIPLNSLFSYIAEVFNAYQVWEIEVHSAISKCMDLSVVGKLSESIFRNPINLIDKNFRWIFFSDNTKRFRLPEDYSNRENKKHIPYTAMNILKNSLDNSDFHELMKPYKRSSPYGYDSLCYNLFRENEYLATLYIDNISHPFTERDEILLAFLGEEIKRALFLDRSMGPSNSQRLRNISQKLIHSEPVENSELIFALQKFDWKLNDDYFCIKAISPTDSHPAAMMEIIGEELCTGRTNSAFVCIESELLIIVNLKPHSPGYEELSSEICTSLRNANLIMGVSSVFSDYFHLLYGYRMCSAALSLGRRIDERKDIYYFDDYLLDYLFQKCSEDLSPEMIRPSKLSNFLRIDREKGTDYTRILDVYLRSNMNIAETARILYMHRNTLLYKLERIREILDMDLENPDVRLMLMLCMWFIENRVGGG